MIKYLLDTDIASFLMKRKFSHLQHRLLRELPEDWAISSVSLGEIFFGLEPFAATHPLRIRTLLFTEAAQVLPWPAEAAAPYARIRHLTRNQPVGDRDLMIAAHAIALDVVLVTNNVKHFGRIGAPLRFENWLHS